MNFILASSLLDLELVERVHVKVSGWTKDQNYLRQYLVRITLSMEAINADANNIENTYKRLLTLKFSHLPLPFTKESLVGCKNIIYETQN
jgi:hypothetical protein